MRIPLAIGYSLVTLMTLSLLAIFCLADLLPERNRDVAVAVSEISFFLGYVGLWAWMLFDHIFSGDREYAALISILLVVGGGFAGIVYFLSVFRPRALARAPAGASGVGV
jgi:hypothetical protein